MNLPKRSRKNRSKAKTNGLDPDVQLTPPEAVEYLKARGVNATVNSLAVLRWANKGPQYGKCKGSGRIHYTPKYLNPYIESRQPRIVNLPERMRSK